MAASLEDLIGGNKGMFSGGRVTIAPQAQPNAKLAQALMAEAFKDPGLSKSWGEAGVKNIGRLAQAWMAKDIQNKNLEKQKTQETLLRKGVSDYATPPVAPSMVPDTPITDETRDLDMDATSEDTQPYKSTPGVPNPAYGDRNVLLRALTKADPLAGANIAAQIAFHGGGSRGGTKGAPANVVGAEWLADIMAKDAGRQSATPADQLAAFNILQTAKSNPAMTARIKATVFSAMVKHNEFSPKPMTLDQIKAAANETVSTWLKGGPDAPPAEMIKGVFGSAPKDGYPTPPTEIVQRFAPYKDDLRAQAEFAKHYGPENLKKAMSEPASLPFVSSPREGNATPSVSIPMR